MRANEVYTVESSNGELYLDADGNVLRQETNSQCGKLVRFDLEEYKQIWNVDTVPKYLDILDLRGIFEDGSELVWKDYRERAKGKS